MKPAKKTGFLEYWFQYPNSPLPRGFRKTQKSTLCHHCKAKIVFARGPYIRATTEKGKPLESFCIYCYDALAEGMKYHRWDWTPVRKEWKNV